MAKNLQKMIKSCILLFITMLFGCAEVKEPVRIDRPDKPEFIVTIPDSLFDGVKPIEEFDPVFEELETYMFAIRDKKYSRSLLDYEVKGITFGYGGDCGPVRVTIDGNIDFHNIPYIADPDNLTSEDVKALNKVGTIKPNRKWYELKYSSSCGEKKFKI